MLNLHRGSATLALDTAVELQVSLVRIPPSNMPGILFHRTRERTENTVLTHICVWVKKQKINIYTSVATDQTKIQTRMQ